MLKRLTSQHSEPIYSTQMLRELETAAVRALPAHALMQRAGTAVARLVQARFPHARRILVLAGAGNNGGDGLVAATQLQRAGRNVYVLACGAGSWPQWMGRLPPDAAWAWAWAWDAAQTPCAVLAPGAPLPEADLYVDALLGIGLGGPVREQTAAIIAQLNAQGRAPVLSVDLPSGLDADTGDVAGPCVRATATLSLLGLKPGLCTGLAAALCGTLWSDDLDLPTDPAAAGSRCEAGWLGADQIRPLLPDLERAAHKGQRGDVGVIGGAAGMAGAVLLAAHAAARLGAGRVYAGLLDARAPTVDCAAPDLMLRPPASLLETQNAHACLLLGPGGGTEAPFRSHLAQALTLPIPLVLDADALNLLADSADADAAAPLQALLRKRKQATVLTPHPLEAARLLGSSARAVQANRLLAARTLAQRHAAWVVLKGQGTVIASPQQQVWINPTGNGLLATAGSGDVLAGAIAALLAAVWLHGCAAERYARCHGASGLTAADLPRWMTRCWADLATADGGQAPQPALLS